MALVKGINSVAAAIAKGAGRRLLLREGKLNRRQQDILLLAERAGLTIERRAVEDVDLSGQGVALEAADAAPADQRALEDLLDQGRSDWLFLVLDGVTDPRNLGACLRNAASFGVDGVIVPKDRSAPLNEAAIKTASGGASLVPLFQVTNLARTLAFLKAANIWLVGTVLESEQALADIDLKGPMALVMGAEDKGLRQKTRECCDFLAKIPMPLPDLSLNVSVATGICLYEAHQQRVA
jgi:23S rRNA (guanosine2251-2'-O)-methyltransferase